MLRRLIAFTALTAGVTTAVTLTLAAPALAKGPSQASLTGPGLARPVVVSGNGEPGQPGSGLALLAEQSGLFAAMFGTGVNLPGPHRLATPPRRASLGPRYELVYTVPGVQPRPGQEFGRVRQFLYPEAAGGPVIDTPPGQHGFGQGQLPVTGWFRGGARLARTLARLGVPPRPGTAPAASTAPGSAAPGSAAPESGATPAAARGAAAAGVQGTAPAAARHGSPAAAHHASPAPLGWLAAAIVVILAAALGGTALWLRRRRPVTAGR